VNTIMNAEALNGSILGDTDLAAPLSISAPGALYEDGFSGKRQKMQNRSFSRPSGARLPTPTSLTETDERTNYQPRTLAPGRTKTGSTSMLPGHGSR
jgi:hypothetical protein